MYLKLITEIEKFKKRNKVKLVLLLKLNQKQIYSISASFILNECNRSDIKSVKDK